MALNSESASYRTAAWQNRHPRLERGDLVMQIWVERRMLVWGLGILRRWASRAVTSGMSGTVRLGVGKLLCGVVGVHGLVFVVVRRRRRRCEIRRRRRNRLHDLRRAVSRRDQVEI